MVRTAGALRGNYHAADSEPSRFGNNTGNSRSTLGTQTVPVEPNNKAFSCPFRFDRISMIVASRTMSCQSRHVFQAHAAHCQAREPRELSGISVIGRSA